MKKILTVTEIETLKWMAILAELKIKELQKENNPEKRVKYISAENLLENELEIQKVRSEEFDLLIVDDIQILGEKDILIQEKFFNLFNSQHYKNKQMVFSSDSEPDQLKNIQSRLIVRFKWGMTACLTSLED